MFLINTLFFSAILYIILQKLFPKKDGEIDSERKLVEESKATKDSWKIALISSLFIVTFLVIIGSITKAMSIYYPVLLLVLSILVILPPYLRTNHKISSGIALIISGIFAIIVNVVGVFLYVEVLHQSSKPGSFEVLFNLFLGLVSLLYIAIGLIKIIFRFLNNNS